MVEGNRGCRRGAMRRSRCLERPREAPPPWDARGYRWPGSRRCMWRGSDRPVIGPRREPPAVTTQRGAARDENAAYWVNRLDAQTERLDAQTRSWDTANSGLEPICASTRPVFRLAFPDPVPPQDLQQAGMIGQPQLPRSLRD